MTQEKLKIEASIQSGDYYLVQNPNTSCSAIWKDDLRHIAYIEDSADVILKG